MPSIGARCHELRIRDSKSRVTWRIIYRLDGEVILIADVFVKKTQKTAAEAIARCKARLSKYDNDQRSQS